MTEQTADATKEEKANYLAKEVLSYLGVMDVSDMLRSGDPESGVEPVSDEVMSEINKNNLSRDFYAELARDESEVFEAFRRIVSSWAQKTIGEASGRIPPAGTYANVVSGEMAKHPDWFAAEILQHEKDIGGGTTYDSPEDYEMDLVLERIAAEQLDVDNVQERKELWDSILKYSEYRVSLTVESSDGEREVVKTLVRKSSTDAHNDALETVRRSLGEDEQVKTGVGSMIETTVVTRYTPDFDPLDDLHEFVFYY